jgi:bacteriocin biosynthesis cyclodehydratase domain-containing protein
VLELADPGAARLLDLLDGTRTEVGLVREAVRLGIASEDAVALLAALSGAGLVLDVHALYPLELSDAARRRLAGEANALALDAPPRAPSPAVRLRRRQAANVILTGSSQLAVPIATVLGSAGVGHVDPDVSGVARLGDAAPAGLLPGDAHRPRGVAAADAVRRAAPDAQLTPLRPSGATFAVLVGFSAPAALTALAHANRRLAHLAVTIRDGAVVVGPLVRPGRTACLNCLDLHRRDRDPAWPTVSAQLHTTPDTAEPVAATTLLVGAAYAAAEVLSHIDGGEPVTLGATVEIDRPGHETRRQWVAHPACGCVRLGRGPSRAIR